jgi:hypothetical protein
MTWLIGEPERRGSSQASRAEEMMMQTRMKLPMMGWPCSQWQNIRRLLSYKHDHHHHPQRHLSKLQLFTELANIFVLKCCVPTERDPKIDQANQESSQEESLIPGRRRKKKISCLIPWRWRQLLLTNTYLNEGGGRIFIRVPITWAKMKKEEAFKYKLP